MRYVQLRAFHYVCLYGGFSRAAEALFLTQPAISDQIRKLEESYDLLLFQRNGKQVVPTAAGEKLLEITHRFFDAEAQAHDLLSEQRALTSGTLRIIADSAVHLIGVLSDFRQRFPDVQIRLQTGNSETVLARLRDYEADIGVLGVSVPSSQFDSIHLGTTPLVAFVAADHTLADRRTIALPELVEHALVLREQGSRTRALFEAVVAERGLELRASIEAQGREAVQQIVSVGAGVGIVSRAELASDPRLVPLTIEDCRIDMQEYLICLHDRAASKRIAAFFEAARQRLAQTAAAANR